MHDSVETGLLNELTFKHIVPVLDWQLACQDKSLPVIPVIDNLLKIMLYLTFEPEHACRQHLFCDS